MKAENYFAKASGTSGNLNTATGALYTAKGDYSKAKTAFVSEATNNAGLVQILNADYSGAMRTLNAVEKPDALAISMISRIRARSPS